MMASWNLLVYCFLLYSASTEAHPARYSYHHTAIANHLNLSPVEQRRGFSSADHVLIIGCDGFGKILDLDIPFNSEIETIMQSTIIIKFKAIATVIIDSSVLGLDIDAFSKLLDYL